MIPYLWTVAPFIIFLTVIVVFETKHRKGDKAKRAHDEQYMQPILKVTARLHEQQFGSPPKELEKAFPELRQAK